MQEFLKSNSVKLYVLITVLLFLARSIFFANTYGGIEHDSGWYLGVAKNLALRGIYASYTNTVTEEGVGAFPSIHGRFSVQDSQGFTYFPAGVTLGPGYVMPEAFIIKIFGSGFWQYRAWPLIAFTGLLILLFYFVYSIGGLLALIIFQVWLWAIPQIYVVFSYEAFSEHIALFYLLLSILFLHRSLKKNTSDMLFFSGIFLSLAALTKYIYAITAAPFLIWLFFDLYKNRSALKKPLQRWSLFFIGLVLPIILFLGYRNISTLAKFGPSGLDGINQDFMIHFKSEGSDIKNLLHPNWEFVSKKILLWSNVAIKYPMMWLLLLVSPFITFILAKKDSRIILSLLYLITFVSVGWFVMLESFGWTRRTWQSFPLAIALVSIMIGLLIDAKYTLWKKITACILIIVVIPFSLRYDKLEPGFVIPQKTLDSWSTTRYSEGIQLLPHQPQFSITDQKETVKYFQSNIRPQDRIYYIGGLLVAELSPLVDKVFYPIGRYENLRYTNPDGGNSYLIFGPYQLPPLSIVSSDHITTNVQNYCSKVTFQNSSYVLCKLN